VTTTGPGAGWFPDPGGSGGQRYYDGAAWTQHVAPPPYAPLPYGPQAGYGQWVAPWKGAELGRPASGPGALADPGRRLAARLLDGLLLLGVLVVLAGITIPIVAPHVGPIFPKINPNSNRSEPVPGFAWIYVAVAGCALVTALISIGYETFATTRYGRTLGKRWLHIRPLRVDGTALGGWRALGRSATRVAAGAFSWFGLLDSLWCLWDGQRQCLHDKIADTIVVVDPSPPTPSTALSSPTPP
jgi:uncharacterized RDD family membrane protein YckC